MSIWDRIQTEMAEAARKSVIASIKRGARNMIDNADHSAGIKWTSKDVHEVRRLKNQMIDLGRSKHPLFCASRLITLRQAYIVVRLTRFRERATLVAADMDAA